jgi:hypothetical protein
MIVDEDIQGVRKICEKALTTRKRSAARQRISEIAMPRGTAIKLEALAPEVAAALMSGDDLGDR